ncbi:MAG: hypothetical protein QE487_14815 [Fluviicola sp.]|nr:hypothetical protein [Fluviicola sp.]
MKRKRTAIITGVAAAAITFGSLMAKVGPRHFDRHCHSQANHCGYQQGHHGQHHQQQATRGEH